LFGEVTYLKKRLEDAQDRVARSSRQRGRLQELASD
jgi:hypothetical protein